MTFSAFDQTKEQIMNDVLYILDNIRKDRSFLNKHFQNSINNYFLEDYAGNFLKEYLNMPRAKDITKYVQNKYMDLKGTKYMKLMYGYIQELKDSNQINQFKNLLLANMQSESYDNDKNSKEWQSNVWKKAFSLFVHHFTQVDNDQFKGIFEIWNSLFPRSKILRKRQENVNHRPREYQEQEINNVRSAKTTNNSQNQQQNVFQFTAAEQQAIQNFNQTLFGNDFKTGVFYPNQKNQYHLKQQFEYCVVPQQQQQQPMSQFNAFYSNQSKPINNQIYDDQIEINFDLPQQQDNINDFFANVPEDFLNKSDTSSPLSSAPQTMNNFNHLEQQQDQVIEQHQQFQQQQPSLSRNNSYKFLQQLNQSNQISQFGENQFNMFQDNEENDYQNPQYFCNYTAQESNFLDLSQSYYFNQNQYQQNFA